MYPIQMQADDMHIRDGEDLLFSLKMMTNRDIKVAHAPLLV